MFRAKLSIGLVGLLATACGSKASFTENTAGSSAGSGDSASMPVQKDTEDANSKNARTSKDDINLPDVKSTSETSFDLTVKTRADSTRLDEPVDFYIALDTSNSITRHADALAAALPTFLNNLNALGIRMNIRMVTLDEYVAQLKDFPGYNVLAPSWFFNKNGAPDVLTPFPSAKLFHSDNKDEITALSTLIRNKARTKSKVETEPMYCALQTLVGLLDKSIPRDRHVLTVSDEDNNWQFKTFDLAGNLKSSKPIACGQTHDTSGDAPYQYNVQKSWTEFSYNESVAAKTTYVYNAKIKTYGSCQATFNDSRSSIPRYNLYTLRTARKAVNVYSCEDTRSPATYNCAETGGSWSANASGNYSGYKVCDSYSQASCDYFVDAVPVTESVDIGTARSYISQGATCNVSGSKTRVTLPSNQVSNVFGFASCNPITCSINSYSRNTGVLETEKGAAYFQNCNDTNTDRVTKRSLVQGSVSGNVVTGFTQLDPNVDETIISERSGITGVGNGLCENALPQTLPAYVIREDAGTSDNGFRNQQFSSDTALSRSQVVARLGITDADLDSFTETPQYAAAQSVAFKSTYQLANLASNIAFVGQQAKVLGEDAANQALASYRFQRVGDIVATNIYVDGGRYTDNARLQALQNSWKPTLLNNVNDVVAAFPRSTFHSFTKVTGQVDCLGEIAAAHVELTKKTSGAAWDLCSTSTNLLSDFFDKLLRKVIDTVVLEYRIAEALGDGTVIEVKKAGSDVALKVGVDYDIVKLSDNSVGISFKAAVKAGEVYHIRAQLPKK